MVALEFSLRCMRQLQWSMGPFWVRSSRGVFFGRMFGIMFLHGVFWTLCSIRNLTANDLINRKQYVATCGLYESMMGNQLVIFFCIV